MLFRNTSIYALVSIANGAISFALLPILTRWLDPAEYGLLAIHQTLVAFTVAATGLSVHGAIGRRWFADDHAGFPRYVGTCLIILLLSTGAIAIISDICSGPLSMALGFPAAWLWTVWLTAAVQFILLCFLTIAQSASRPGLYASVQLTAAVVNAAASLLLVIVLSAGWLGRIWANLGTLAVAAGAALLIMHRLRWCRVAWDGGDARHALAFGLPLVPHAFFGWGLSNLDRLLVAFLLGTQDAGLMLAAMQLALLVGLVEDAFNRAWAPWFMSTMKQGTDRERVLLAAYIWRYAGALIAFSLLVALAAPLLAALVLGPRYAAAGELAFWYCMAAAAGGLYKMAANQLFWAERTWAVLASSGLACAVLVPACVIGIQLNGLVGAAQAACAAQLVLWLTATSLARRFVSLPWPEGLRLALRPTWRLV